VRTLKEYFQHVRDIVIRAGWYQGHMPFSSMLKTSFSESQISYFTRFAALNRPSPCGEGQRTARLLG
jgi:hypothetical protein